MRDGITKVLFVDDDDVFRSVLERELSDLGLSVRSLPSGEGCLDTIADFEPHIVLLDLRLPGRSGWELLGDIRRTHENVQVILLTGHGSVPEAVEAMRRGACDFLIKPSPVAAIEQALQRARERYELRVENERLRRAAGTGVEPPKILGRSDSIRELANVISRVASSDSSVLITGESGTGKELVARRIHWDSSRRDAPLVVVNCSAIPDTLVESELFGHERGAFTGADRRRIGLFEAAHGGTLFLDEVGELPAAVQPRLLRALQFGEFQPVGSARSVHVDVRVVAATNRPLLAGDDAEPFRRDLYYRLCTLEVTVPPLRDRPEDIDLLARRFLARAADAHGRSMSLEDDALDALRRWHWPGNVRELENAMARLAVLSRHDAVGAETIERLILEGAEPQPVRQTTLKLAEIEKRTIEEALARFSGSKPQAAEALGIALKTLYNKLDRYGLRS